MSIAADFSGSEQTDAARAERKARIAQRIARTDRILNLLALGWITPILKMMAGENPKTELAALWRMLGVPLTAIIIFLSAWAYLAPQVKTSLGAVPGPAQVWEQAGNLLADHYRAREKEAAFYQRQDERNAKWIAQGQPDSVKYRTYTGAPTYVDQISTSLQTVFLGFLIATVVAVPLGIVCGLSPTMNAAFNPLIQIFKPVSPLAWLPIVTMIVSAVYVSDDPWFAKSFLISAITVTLCSLWPTLINTAVGVASIDKDLMNVGRVLNLSWFTTVRKLVLPSALPLIFTGLRLSLGVGWMVLIAAEMLAQNPGLGKFVWDEFQNGSSSSLAKIMVAVFTIGLIGFLLDRIMLALQSLTTYQATR
ncbi:nitrate/nitrite transport system permease protein [Filomicrobium insigne]|uniref:Nitrate/nitrite transport system permease protein n=1 Tax=Filomicrobium insigne TaxID=418854 RepID=A0A1H0I3Q5_9HYPH|nr:ABC transporter permease [Filomicrobium insigne]SDO26039.1 nitrate/nitrite transport system permease protein [Filomicrobium insigne]